jgi:hypothetical protein
MKTSALILLLAVCSSLAQGTFQNLDFEEATIVPIPGDPYDRVQFAAAFPGWTGYTTVMESRALYNGIFLDSSGTSIVDYGWAQGQLGFSGPIQGNFSVLMMAGLSLSLPTVPVDTILSQTGLLPAAAQSLLFKEFNYGPSFFRPFRVSLGGQILPLVQLSITTNYVLYGADVHHFAGQTAELAFTTITTRPHTANNYVVLDSIEFSPVAIPEPSSLALLAVGTVFLTRFSLRSLSYKSHGAAGKKVSAGRSLE